MDENERMERLRKKANNLPLVPGVYIMHNLAGTIIYIGKAKILKNRVTQYFRSQNRHNDKVRQMVANVNDFEYIVCDSEFEALILECSLIKQHMPKYNILLKDDKGYHYIKITRGQWPSLKAVMQIDDKDAEHLGPYNSAYVVRQTVDEAYKVFKLPQCQKQFPRDIKPKSRPCLNYYIENCSAPCAGKISCKDYNDSFTQAIDFIKGGAVQSVQELKKKMEEAAEDLEFERAAKIRDRITAIERINQKQKVITSTYMRQDIIALAMSSDAACFEVFVFINGRLTDREEFVVDTVEDAAAARAEFIRRYYSMREDIPPRIAVDGEFEDKELLEQWLSQKAGKKVSIILPQRGEVEQLVQMCLSNASERLAQRIGQRGNRTAALDELARLLGLSTPPKYIEAYDISNTAGSENVAGMVTFMDGESFKAGYRLFKIKSFEGQDDLRSMREVLERRFDEYEKNKETGDGFGRLPDLILLDGGHGQLSAVMPVLKDKGLNIPIFGMVKDSKHKTRAIAADGGDIAIKANRRAYTLVSNIQEEVHRFAIGFHHKRSAKKNLNSELLQIKGIGPKKAAVLMKHFKTMSAIKQANADELIKAPGVSQTDADNIIEFYKQTNN